MKVTLAEVSITMPEGAILRIVRYHDATQRKSGPAHCELIAERGTKFVRMEAPIVSSNSIAGLLELCRRHIERVKSSGKTLPAPVRDPQTWAEFVSCMVEREMFLPDKVLEAQK